jgi:hypothetical protein
VPLADKPLHLDTLAGLQAEFEAAFHLTFFVVELLGRAETGRASEDQVELLRLLTPVAKLTTGKQVVAVLSEVIEAFGGTGYVEDGGLPLLLRDAQVLPIWEGTTNVLSLDALRAAVREDALRAWTAIARRRLEPLGGGPLRDAAAEVARRIDAVEAAVPRLLEAGSHAVESTARRLALSMAALGAAVPLLEQGAWGLAKARGERSALVARRFVHERIPPPPDPGGARDRLAADALLSGLED